MYAFGEKMPFSYVFVFGQNKTRKKGLIMCYIQKKPFLAIKNSIFQSPKNRLLLKGLSHAFG